MAQRFEIERVRGVPVTTNELLEDLKRCGMNRVDSILTQADYVAIGKFDPTTYKRRFGSWNKAVELAGLKAGNTVNYPDEILFENLMQLWEYYGRQPRLAELALPPSTISHGPYRHRFLTWMSALEAFVSYANAAEVVAPEGPENSDRKRTPRQASLRLRFQVLKRDSFCCRACGRSPSNIPGLHLHVEHIIAWSLGGETVLENLQTLCEACNLGKSNVL